MARCHQDIALIWLVAFTVAQPTDFEIRKRGDQAFVPLSNEYSGRDHNHHKQTTAMGVGDSCQCHVGLA